MVAGWGGLKSLTCERVAEWIAKELGGLKCCCSLGRGASFRQIVAASVQSAVFGNGMFTAKLNIIVPACGVIIALIEPPFAGTTPSVPAPIVGAGLPVLAVLGGGYWLIKKLRR